MIKILDDSKSLSVLSTDTTNGIGQIQPLSCIVTEELNGIYEAEFTVAETEKHFDALHVSGLLRISAGELEGEQIFRIYKMTKPINGICTVYCQHISYDLSKIAVLPFSSTGATSLCQDIVSHITGGTYPFTMTTDIESTSTFRLDIPRTFRECLGGYDGSVLDVFRGEYEWNNLAVIMHSRRGADNGVRIAYGKNLTDFQQEENIENVHTAVLGYATVNEVTVYGSVYHKVQSEYPKVLIVDFSSEYQTDETPTSADLTAKARAYAEANNIEIPHVNLDIGFVPLYHTEEYKNIAPLERVSLGDTVHVEFPKLGVTATARVIRTEWNSELRRYESVQLGDAKANMNTVINQAVGEVRKQTDADKGFLEDQLNEMATLIINGLGLHRTLVAVDGGGYRIYLHNKETLAESDTQYVMSANGFLISTDYGQTWNAGFDSEGNAVLNSLSTITLKALEIQGATITGTTIRGSTIVFGSSRTMTMQTNSAKTGVLFSGNGSVEFESESNFMATNKSSSSATDIWNKFQMMYAQSELNNYNPQKNNIQAGKLALSSSSTDHISLLRTYEISNGGNAAVMVYEASTATQNLVNLTVYDTNATRKGYIELAYNKNSGETTVNIYADSFWFNGSKKW